MSQNINSRSNIDNAMVGEKVVTQFLRAYLRVDIFGVHIFSVQIFSVAKIFFCFLNYPFRECLIFT